MIDCSKENILDAPKLRCNYGTSRVVTSGMVITSYLISLKIDGLPDYRPTVL